MHVAFIGVGNMGRPMLANLLKKGFTATTYDVVPAALDAGAAFVAVSEAFRIAEGYGVDPKVLTQVISKSSGATWVMEKNHPVPGVDPNSTASRDYMPGFMTDLMAKDLGLAVSAARDKRLPVAVAAAAQQVYRMASAHGLGRKDCASVYRFLAPSPD